MYSTISKIFEYQMKISWNDWAWTCQIREITRKNIQDQIYIKFTRTRNPRTLSQKCVSLMYNDDVDDVRQLRFAICEFQLDWTRMLEHSESRRRSKKNEINFDWFRSQQIFIYTLVKYGQSRAMATIRCRRLEFQRYRVASVVLCTGRAVPYLPIGAAALKSLYEIF